jgi:hypothetical protein
MPKTILPIMSTNILQPEYVPKITCVKQGGHWYISLTKYVATKGWQTFTEIAALTDDLLGWLARRRNRITLLLHTQPFEGARVLQLDELCSAPAGGAYYRLLAASQPAGRRLWVCDTSLLVFGDLPYRIFFRKQTEA